MNDAFQAYFRELLPSEEWAAFWQALRERKTRRSLRVNTLKTSKLDLRGWLESQGYTVHDNPYSPDGLDIEGKGQPLALKLPYHSGFTYPQDSSSMFAVELLDPQPGESVIDLTAAPGGKSTHIAQKMKNTGVLFCNDLDSKRIKALQYNLERLGIWNAVITRMKPHSLACMYSEVFDRVLVDPSCSGEGLMVTRAGDSIFWSPKAIKSHSKDQFNALCSAFRLLKPGGRLVYSTCTLNPVEDEEVVKRLIKRFPEAEVIDPKEAGLNPPPQIADLEGVRFWPHKTQTKGFFCMALTKTASTHQNDPQFSAEHSFRPLRRKQSQEILSFVRKQFGLELDELCFTQTEEGLIYAHSRALMGWNLPRQHRFSFPFLQRSSSGLELTQAGAHFLALKAPQSALELNQKQVESLFESGVINLEGKAHYARFALFSLGVLKQQDLQLPQYH